MEYQKKNRLPEQFALFVNGQLHQLKSRPDEPLLWVLRDVLSLTGTKFGCGEGLCGSCTVLIEGKPERSCQISAEDAEGASITTIEGLPENHPVKRAWISRSLFNLAFT